MSSLSLRIFASANPSSVGQPVQPMSKADREFWAILADRRKAASAEARGRMGDGA